MDEYNAGLLNDWGGGNIDWWHDYLRYEIGCANSHWIQQTEQLRATISRLREYAGHHANCGEKFIWADNPQHDITNAPCDCGYDELMKELDDAN